MQIHTAATVLPVPASEAFRFLSSLENIPRWATEFIKGRYDVRGDHALAETGKGPVTMRLRADRDTLVVDHVVEPAPGVAAVFPGRVVALPDGCSLFLFTAIQAPGQSDAAFAADIASLEREMEALPGVVRG